MLALGTVGLWTRQLDAGPIAQAQDTVAELEALGYSSIWIPEAVHREVISHASLLLSATKSIVVATGVARVHARSPQAAALAQRALCERFPGRFLLGLGVSHALVVERVMGQIYGSPLATMTEYLAAMDATRGGSVLPAGAAPRVLAALGPKMLALAAANSHGVHTYVAPVAHTRWAREQLGPDLALMPAIKAVLTTDVAAGRSMATKAVAPTLSMPAYRQNLLRSGFTEADFDGGVSDRVIDALVAIGDVDAIETRVREHLDAGATHVCVEALTGDDTAVPMDAWRELASAFAELNG